MIRVVRGAEPPELATERSSRLPAMRALAQTRDPKSKDFEGYGVAKVHLAKHMNNKCWYCERPVEAKYDPVEHYRPKTLALRGNGLPKHGYWWLAWTWENLMFICPDCNGAKLTHFPLVAGSVALLAEQPPPGSELALLIDPSDPSVDPIDLIEFFDAGHARWKARARNGNPIGAMTVSTLGLDGNKRPEIARLFGDHVNNWVRPLLAPLRDAMGANDRRLVVDRWTTLCRKLLRSTSIYAALSYDALHALTSEAERSRWGLVLPRPPWDPRDRPCVRT